MRDVSQRKVAASPEASKNRCRCPAGASRWYGHQEETVTANIENKTAEVESISSDMASERRQPVQMAQFFQKEIDTQNMNIVVAVRTTGIDATVSQAQQTARRSTSSSRRSSRSSSIQHSKKSNLLRNETDQHWGEQDGQRHGKQQAGKMR